MAHHGTQVWWSPDADSSHVQDRFGAFLDEFRQAF
jgi:hypothetical protein